MGRLLIPPHPRPRPRWALLLCGLALALPACRCPVRQKAKAAPFQTVADCPGPREADAEQMVQRGGQVYSRVDGHTLRYDFARPRGKGPFGLVLLIHGGAWSEGSRAHMDPELRMLVAEGFAAATVDYRLVSGGKNRFPAAIEDLRCAVRVLRARAHRLRIDPDRMVASGVSAGGHLAALLATAQMGALFDGPCPEGEGQRVRLRGAVALSAPLDLTQTPYSVERGIIRGFLGASPARAPRLAALASPLSHLDPGDPPLLLLHGGRDEVVSVAQARRFWRKMRKLGLPGAYVEVPEGDHGFFIFKGQAPYARARCTALAFFSWLLR